METRFGKNEVRITGLCEFDTAHIFENGQTFRFSDMGGGVYEGVAFGRFLRVKRRGDEIILWPVTQQEFEEIWSGYFDLGRDYAGLFAGCGDEALQRGCEYARGLRILRQEPFETLVCFIISANNNVKRIRQIVQSICVLCGRPFDCEGRTFYAFPTPEELAGVTEEQLRECGCGYRAPYILDTAKKVAGGFDLGALYDAPYEEARAALTTLAGVGPKVADCVLLFAYGKLQAFPADVWVKRLMKELYGVEGAKEISEFALQRFGENAGIAQQYLFYYARENGIK